MGLKYDQQLSEQFARLAKEHHFGFIGKIERIIISLLTMSWAQVLKTVYLFVNTSFLKVACKSFLHSLVVIDVV